MTIKSFNSAVLIFILYISLIFFLISSDIESSLVFFNQKDIMIFGEVKVYLFDLNKLGMLFMFDTIVILVGMIIVGFVMYLYYNDLEVKK